MFQLAIRATEEWWDTPHYGFWLDAYYAGPQEESGYDESA
jgi:hypothetical protein